MQQQLQEPYSWKKSTIFSTVFRDISSVFEIPNVQLLWPSSKERTIRLWHIYQNPKWKVCLNAATSSVNGDLHQNLLKLNEIYQPKTVSKIQVTWNLMAVTFLQICIRGFVWNESPGFAPTETFSAVSLHCLLIPMSSQRSRNWMPLHLGLTVPSSLAFSGCEGFSFFQWMSC